MHNSTTLSPHMVEMFRTNLPSIFRADLVGTDYSELRTTLSLIEGYLILGGLDFVATFGDTLASLFHLTVGRVRPRAAPHAIRPVEVLLLLAGNSSSSPEVMHYLFSSDVMTILIRPCLAALGTLSCNDNAAAVTTYTAIAKHFETHQESDIALVSYLAVCARCMLLDTSFMLKCCRHVLETSSPAPSSSLCAALAAGGDDNVGATLLKGICRLLIEKFDTFGYSKGGTWRRRLSCLALLCLFPSADPDLLDWLPEVLYICDDVLSEAASAEGAQKVSRLGSKLISIADDDEDEDDEGGEECDDPMARARSPLVSQFETYLATDPVMTCSLHAVLVEKVEGLSGVLGEEYLQTQVYNSIDHTTLSRILGNAY